MNLGGPHDQAQIQAEGGDPLSRPKDRTSPNPARDLRLASSKSAARPDTKHARIIAMLRTPPGATIAAIMTATDWQQHSVRGFLAGVVRKKLGLNLVSEQTDKGRVYRIKDSKASLLRGHGGMMRCRRNVARVVPRPKHLSKTRSRICAVSISGDYVHAGRVYFKSPHPLI